jgi:hypothetical protein
VVEEVVEPIPEVLPADPIPEVLPASPEVCLDAIGKRLYHLLRDKPMFVDWYLTSFANERHNWSLRKPPRSAAMAKLSAHWIVCVVLSLTGVGLLVSIPYGLVVAWLWLKECMAYRTWCDQIDPLLRQAGVEGFNLMERMPRTRTFAQFLKALKDYSKLGARAAKIAGHSQN